MTDFRSAVEEVFRRESGRIIAGLIRASQSFDLAEEAMQDALASALVDWQRNGLPMNPAAWINAAAHRKLIDYARRDHSRMLYLSLCEGMKQISYGKQSDAKNSAPKIQVMTRAMLEPPMHPRKQMKCFGDVSKDDYYQTSCAE